MLNPYEPIEARIEDIIQEAPFVKTFVLECKERMNFSPGQFVMVTAKGAGEAPFTISSAHYETNFFQITIKNSGIVTDRLLQAKKSDSVGVRGPYGKGYPIGSLYGKDVIIAAGDMGIVSLRSFLQALLMQKEMFKRLVLYYTVQTPQDIIYKETFRSWMSEKKLQVHILVDTPDSSWANEKTDAPVLLEDIEIDPNNSAAAISGPAEMIKASVLKFLQRGLRPQDIYVTLYRNMSCGLGKCGHCGVGRFYVCKDGPVFNYDQIREANDIWD